jgi:hypothetical protein
MSKKQQPIDLTSPEAVAIGQEVYDRMVAGQVQDVEAELDKALGRDSKQT